MKRLRPLFALLLAWTLCFQAVASVSDVRCQHVEQRPAVVRHMMDGHMMTMASMSPEEHAKHAGHSGMVMPARGKSVTDKASNPICDCGAACSCAGGCAVSCQGATGGHSVAFSFDRFIPTAYPESVAISTAHGLDLFRPPSIS